MQIQDYSEKALSTRMTKHTLGDITAELMYQILGLVGESGEVAEKFKKIIRDDGGVLTDEKKKELVKELGDILWYVNSVAHLLDSDLNEVAQMNLDKITSRKERGVQHGSGDNR